jgi:hypothetical protein
MRRKCPRVGDIVIFIGAMVASGPTDIMGLIVNDSHNLEDDDQSVLIQFYGEHGAPTGPVHYYHHELDNYLEDDAIRIIHAS